MPARMLSAAERRREVDSAIASARAEGLDPSAAQPIFDAWATGEIDLDQLVADAQTLAAEPRAPRAA